MAYAQNTAVPVERSKMEIERTVLKYGATGFITGWRKNDQALVTFEMNDRRVRFILPLPHDDTNTKKWEKECRRLWRALALCIKAKLEAVESGISQFEEEFMPYFVMSNGMTVAERIIPDLTNIISTGNMPPLLPGPK